MRTTLIEAADLATGLDRLERLWTDPEFRAAPLPVAVGAWPGHRLVGTWMHGDVPGFVLAAPATGRCLLVLLRQAGCAGPVDAVGWHPLVAGFADARTGTAADLLADALEMHPGVDRLTAVGALVTAWQRAPHRTGAIPADLLDRAAALLAGWSRALLTSGAESTVRDRVVACTGLPEGHPEVVAWTAAAAAHLDRWVARLPQTVLVPVLAEEVWPDWEMALDDFLEDRCSAR